MLVSPQQMLDAEADWMNAHGNAGTLMEKAGLGISRAIAGHFPPHLRRGTLVLALGPGNNAGDACVAARPFAAAGWTIRWIAACPERPLSDLTQKNLAALGECAKKLNSAHEPDPDWPRPLVVVDGLLGIGARPPLRGPVAAATQWINHWRTVHNAFTVSIDLPTGLDGTTGEADTHCIVADLTATVCQPKTGLVTDNASPYVGRLEVIPLPELQPAGDTTHQVTTRQMLAAWLPRPAHDQHKSTAGRVLVVAGSPGMTGAAALTAHAALRSGAGLVTIITHPSSIDQVAARCAPEIMVQPFPSDDHIDWKSFDAVALGPGLGANSDTLACNILRQCPLPVVVDADALNALSRLSVAERSPLLDQPAGPRILTPHPGEFRRLANDLTGTRAERARAFTERHPGSVLLLKGQRTLTGSQDGPLLANPTGHAGMATAGMGDTLTGICAAFAARGLAPAISAAAAAWIHGRAAEIASFLGPRHTAVDSLTASDVIDHIGSALDDLRTL
ncbi:NAD(P)H-hydrate dehydratase [Sulfuriroseicoccus oceanibius]|uniref:ADP-dependent (S)-NAD(P)H-hydrate dehydratase n=1 Tax=Sulfuriroseicoccus oceanibius TaxID=2707525 RepID=A0A6B3L694_9BACT|nr:NAD(P)H-hydrate dehydratase [Sulfuriroseicoccus oceanibius]QQL45656.1 NAD(P)H-hydrate dehydratase [Sulfuriroseicoccus oceanibius]